MSDVRIVSFTGPSGAGKTSIIKELLRLNPGWRLVTSYTTRGPRNSDLFGEYRCNVHEEEFLDPRKSSKFAWTVSVHGNSYGHLRGSIKSALMGTYPPMWMLTLTPDFVLDFLKLSGGRALPIFVLPPEADILRQRLSARGESEETIVKRIQDCREWTEDARVSDLPYVFLENNGTIEETAQKVIEILGG